MVATQARVQGEGRRNGVTEEDIPDGYIDWDEHYRAWEEYSRRHGVDTAETIERRGGFPYRKLANLLGRNPTTWRPQDPIRHAQFVRKTTDTPGGEPRFEPPADPKRSHIFYAGTDNRICKDPIVVPEYPIVFDSTDAPHCERCFTKLTTWMNWWVDSGRNRG